MVVPAYSEFIVDGRAKHQGPAIGIIEPDTVEQGMPAPAAAPAAAPALMRAQAPVPLVMRVGQGVDRHWTIGTIRLVVRYHYHDRWCTVGKPVAKLPAAI